MRITVKFKDGMIEAVPSSTLNELINLREIESFHRDGAWVELTKGPLRRKLRPINGPGKRAYDIFLE